MVLSYSEEWENFSYKEAIFDYTNIIAELQKLYEQTPTSDRYMRARISSRLKEAKRELVRTQAEYEMFKKYRERTAISR